MNFSQNESEAPSLESGSLIFADLDVPNHRVLVLKEDGLWDYSLENKKWRLLDSLSSLPIDVREYEFGYDALNEQIKLWHRGIGTVYNVDPQSYEIHRLDNSHVHRNQYAHQPFFKEGTIYAFGGYGYWLWKNYITYFNEELQEWNIQNVHPESDVPDPRIPETGIYIPSQDAFYFFGGDMPDVKNRADDQFTGRSELNDIWKFSFEDNTWTKIGKVPHAYDFYKGSGNRRYGRINKITGSFYSPESMTWYIPTAKEGRGDLVNLIPVDLSTGNIMQPIVLESGLNPDEFLPANFLFSRESGNVVIVGLKKITGSKRYPVEIVTFSEDSLLARNDSGSFVAGNSRYIYIGGILTVGILLLLVYWNKRNKSLGRLNSIALARGEIQQLNWLNEQEKDLLAVFADSGSYMETNELEERLWQDIDNYDYRRKLRNETIKSINRKFKRHYDTESGLISRIKDPEDNRRYLYGLNRDFLETH
ncbi:MAG: kelch repeat-containing protein [Candidatus Halalkalibacterium sp. M3_1C_030]